MGVITDDEINQILGNEDSWFRTGSILFELSEVARNHALNGRMQQHLTVGEPVAKWNEPGSPMAIHTRLVSAEMMYAFAVENWLKGLVVMAFHRKSQKTRKKMHVELTRLVGTEADVQEILAGFQHPAVAPILEQYANEESAENKTRRDSAMTHRGHQLAKLAQVAGLSGLSQCDLDYLEVLSEVNMLGRYPAPASARDLPDTERFLTDRQPQERLNSAIRKRYDELLRGPGQP